MVDSFDIMIDGMEREEFLRFRMALLPASGFQSAQYRMIEFRCTDPRNLIHHTKREELTGTEDPKKILENLYWKQGAKTLKGGEKTLTLKQFEEKYDEEFEELIEDHLQQNVWKHYKSMPEADQQDEDLIALMKSLDQNANVRWPLVHMRSAGRYLDKKPEIIAATGGTNWQKYLPPKNQRIMFFPELWSEEAVDTWGMVNV